MRTLRARIRLHGIVAVLLTALTVISVGSGAPGDTARVSLSSAPANAQGTDDSSDASISANGRWVAFTSSAPNLVAGDTNLSRDVFVRDRQTGTTTRVSVSTSGAQGNNDSFEPEIAADGSAVAFTTRATNLVPGDTNGATDILVRDLVTGTTTRVDKTMAGGETNFGSVAPSISDDGRYVAYASSANNIYPGDVNAGADIFVYDRTFDVTQHVSVSSGGASSGFGEENNNPSISGNGRYVVFESGSTTFDLLDTNSRRDIYLRDRTGGTTTRISRPTAGGVADNNSMNARISSDGNWITYASDATNLAPGDTNGVRDVFVTSRVTLSTDLVSRSSGGAIGDGSSDAPAINQDGTYVAFDSAAANLVAGDSNNVPDIFVVKRSTGTTTRESLSNNGLQSVTASSQPDLTGDGQNVAFQSFASDLVSGDTNNHADIFVHQLGVADNTPPVVTGTPSSPPNANGWYNANVTITWTSVDPLPSSGAPTQPPATVASTQGANVTYTSAQSCDPNLNCASGSLALSIDKTAPVVSASVPTPNGNGWYHQNVVVGFGCSDALSGIQTCPSPVSLAADGAGQSATGVATDRAGNTGSATASGINIDQTPPVVQFTGNLGSYTTAQTISITCSATDATSGIDTATCPSLNTPASMLIPGPHTLTATATDKAGNTTTASTTFTVVSNKLVPVAQIACGYLALNPGYRNTTELCDKLMRIAQKADADAAANAIDQAYNGEKQFIDTVQGASAKNFTRQQAGLLTALAALVAY